MQKSGIDTIKYHTWPRIPMGKWQAHSNTTNKSQEVSPFPAGDHKAHINRRAQRHSKHNTEQKHKRSTKPFFRLVDNELNSILIVFYARIMKHKCSYCIGSSLNTRPSSEAPNNDKCSKTNICDQYSCIFLPDSTQDSTKTTLNSLDTGFLKAKWRQT